MSEQEPYTGQPEPFAMIPHDRFRAAMELLGMDVERMFAVSIGPWTDSDQELFGLAKLMQEDGAFWRIRVTEGLANPGLSNLEVRYLGILSPRHGQKEED